MSISESQIADYLDQYHQGDTENAFHGLVDLDHDILPGLKAEFRAATDPDLRAFLVTVIWEHRQKSVIPFFGEALRDGENPVWRQAMDGLVAMACPEALAELRSAMNREFSKTQDAVEFHEWLSEAVEQAEEQIVEPPTTAAFPSCHREGDSASL